MSSIPHWSPSQPNILSWKPSNGWMNTFTKRDQIQCTALYFFFQREKGLSEKKAEQCAIMLLCKQKYKGLRYSPLQEKELSTLFARKQHETEHGKKEQSCLNKNTLNGRSS